MTETFTPAGPFRIGYRSNKLADAPLLDYLWIGFSQVTPRRFYDRRLAENTYHHEHVRWFNGVLEYGGDNLTPEGNALFSALYNLQERLAGSINELWLPWEWRNEFGDMVRLRIDSDYLDLIVACLQQVARQMYGEDVEFDLDLAI